MVQRKQFYLGFLAILMTLLTSRCEDSVIDREVIPVEVDLTMSRIDAPLFDTTQSLANRHANLLTSHPQFYPRYFQGILQLGNPNDSSAVDNLAKFTEYSEWKFAQHQIDSVIAMLPDLEKNFQAAFGHYSSIFPSYKIPNICLMNTGFNYGVFPDTISSVLGIGAEFFLGADNPMVKRLPNEVFPAYIREQMIPEAMLPAAMKGWILTTYDEPRSKVDMLNLMVIYGKIMYTLHLCIPDVPEHLHFGYTTAQMKWCQSHENDIWKVIVKEKLLYETDRKTLTDWTGRGPYTRGLSEESPAEMAYFMGKQMVKDYMSQHPEVSPVDLVSVPASTILKSYSPH